jgi:hypothetical protein
VGDVNDYEGVWSGLERLEQKLVRSFAFYVRMSCLVSGFGQEFHKTYFVVLYTIKDEV